MARTKTAARKTSKKKRAAKKAPRKVAKKAAAKKRPTKKKIGRPSTYTKRLADKICGELSAGVSLRTICLDSKMPNRATVFRWLREKDGFSDQYARAKEESSDAIVEEMLDIADDGSNDWMKRHGKDEEEYYVLNGEHVQRSRVRIDTRKWIASKLKPKKYGDKVALTDPDGGPLSVQIVDPTRSK